MFVQNELYKQGRSISVSKHKRVTYITVPTRCSLPSDSVTLRELHSTISAYWPCSIEEVVAAFTQFNGSVVWESCSFQVGTSVFIWTALIIPLIF
jgi:hypothetical protein